MNDKVKKELREKALDYVDYIIEEHYTPDFLEIIGSIGGDVVRYRFTAEGGVYAK